MSILAGAVLVAIVLGFNGAPFWLWTIFGGALGYLCLETTCLSFWIPFAIVALFFNLPPLRRILSSIVMNLMVKLKFVPTISDTEKEALAAGDVWIEGELFSGKPNFKTLQEQTYPHLTQEEKDFINGPLEELCAMCDDWTIWNEKKIPDAIWAKIKELKLFGMIIPKEYGGLGFTALAHSEVIGKLSARSGPVGVTVMVPNSLGPAELLNHYGTQAQKDAYLPKLATGEEIPCFALTEPRAGSDAGSITASGDVFKGEDGKLYMRLNWNKRWITLAAVATTIGLAFKLRDPDNLLGKGEDPGITCALVPANTPGVKNDRRHDPLGTPFYNCPTQGEDVVVSVDQIIGGAEMAGKGWMMLMGCLAAGRGISLPAQSTAGAKFCAAVVGAHSKVRKQFGLSIGQFEGVQGPLAEIYGGAYSMEAARRYTLGALDNGRKPPVVTAILKYHFTEEARKIINHGMDIVGGAAISQGPKNLLANLYKAAPIAITVEGANILTRTLIIFGQGAIRAHKYAFAELNALENNDVKAFDKAFFAHIGLVFRNTFRATILSLTRGLFVMTPSNNGGMGKYYRKLSWTSAVFSLMADMSLGLLGGKLKTKGALSGRFADVLSHMYLVTSVLRRWEADGQKAEDKPIVEWCLQDSFAKIQQGFEGIYANFDVPLVGWFFKGPILWAARLNTFGTAPKDTHDFKIATMLQIPGEQRDRLTAGLYVPTNADTEQFALYEKAFLMTHESDMLIRKIRKAVRAGKCPKAKGMALIEGAHKAGVISDDEFKLLGEVDAVRWKTIQVDDFAKDYSA